MNKIKALLILFLSLTQITFAQDKGINGKVTDETGEPLPGVNIIVKGQKSGTATDFDGNYNIKANTGDVLVFSYVGYKTVERKVGSSNTINVKMTESSQRLNQVVVTALGIKKEEKSLGYASQQVKFDELKQTNENALSNLQGQVSGVQITQSSGAVGGGIDILIRGVKSLDASINNQPLIIVDGLRISNDISAANILPSAGTNAPSSSEQFSFANRGIDLNPDDIETVTVLKGAAAAALYGVDAANGAIIVTTKKGKKGKPQFSISSKFSMNNVNKYVKLQDKYREGWGGVANITADPNNPNIDPVQHRGYGPEKEYWLLNGATKTFAFYTWGPKYEDDNDPTMKFHNIYRDFFKTGMGNNLNFSVRGGQEKYNYYLSVGRNTNSGIVPNTDFNKTNFRIKANYKLTENFDIQVGAAYTNSKGQLPNNGDKSIMSSMSYWSPSVDVNDYLLPNGKQKNYTPYWIDNPRYFAETSNLKTDVDRIISSIGINWGIADNLNLSYRVSIDNFVDTRNRFVPSDLDVGTQVQGFIIDQSLRSNAINSLLLLKYDFNLNEDAKFTLIGGNEITTKKKSFESIRGEKLIIPGYNNISNTTNLFPYSRSIGKNRAGVFSEIDFSYKDRFFINATARNDWSSALPEKNRSFFYPSVNVSYLFNNLIDPDGEFFSFGKVRVSWANVGKDAPEGKLGRRYYLNDYFGTGGIVLESNEGDLNMKPENQTTTEFGADLRFFGNRLRIDYTYYDNLNTNLIAKTQLPASTGVGYLWTNVGSLRNVGHELLLSAKIIKTNNLNWSTTLNWSTNKGTVENISDKIEHIIYANSGWPGVTSMVKKGDAPGTLYGYKWKYNENGDRIIGANGFPIIDTSEKVVVGNAFPDWVASLQNSVGYKGLNLSFLLEYKKGGEVYDAGQRNAIRDGNLKITEFRYENTILEGVQDDGNGGWKPNTKEVYIDEGYYRSSSKYNRASEILVQDASWVKLRNISLSYKLPKKLLSKSFLNNIELNVSGNNFLLWTPFRGFDPEGSQFSAGSNSYGFTGLNIPLTQSYSFGVKVGF